MKLIKRIQTYGQDGFTLIEVLLVVAIIAILAGIVIIAVNPSQQLGKTRDAQRQADVTTLLDAVYQYSVDNSGAAPAQGTGVAITTTPTEICKTAGGSCATLIDLGTSLLAGEKYLVALPIDPKCPTGCNANGDGYRIAKDASGRYIVSAPNTEVTVPSISVTR